jgi:acetyl esterase/lipase
MLDSMKPVFERVTEETGYTVFAVMHGTQPRYTVNEILPDYQRAVRFIRHHASGFGIDPHHLGIIGFSSGGHISLMTGVRSDDGNSEASDEVEQEPSRVGAVVSYFPPTDFLNYGSEGVVDLGTGVLKPFRRAFFHYDEPREGEETLGREISPRYQASSDDPPILLLHGDKDELVPLQQSELMVDALQDAGGTVRLIVKEGAGHGWANIFEDLSVAFDWFDQYLKVDRDPSE